MADSPGTSRLGIAFVSSPAPALLVLAALVCAVFLAYRPGLEGPFLLDDEPNIRPTAVEELNWETLSLRIRSGPFNGLSRSLTKLSFALTQFTSGYDPRVFKYQNLMLHLGNGLLVFWLAAILFRGPDRRPESGAAACWPALLTTALWLLHPLQVSTVLYAVQRLVLLSTLFCLLATVCYLEGRLLLAKRPWAGSGVMLLSFLVFWPLGLISKENAALLAPALLLIEAFWLRFRTEAGRARQLLWTLIAIFLILPVIVGLSYFGLKHEALLAGYVGRDFDLLERLLSEAHALWFYLQVIVLPIPGQMGLFHDGFPVQRGLDPETLLRILGIAGLLVTAFKMRRRAPLIGLGICWFFLWHALESTIIPLELVFEHRNYLALFGIALAAAAVVRALYRRFVTRRILVAGSAALILLLGLNTASRASTWGSRELFAFMEYQRAPESPRAVEVMFLLSDSKGEHEAAARYLKQLQILVPDHTWPLLHEIRFRCGEAEPPTKLLNQAISRARTGFLRPADVIGVQRLTRTIETGNCANVPHRYIVTIAEALGRNPRAHTSTVRVGALNLWAVAAARDRSPDTAKSVLRESLGIATKISPAWVQATIQAAADAASHLDSYEEAIDFLNAVTDGFEAQLRGFRVSASLALSLESGSGRSDSS